MNDVLKLLDELRKDFNKRLDIIESILKGTEEIQRPLEDLDLSYRSHHALWTAGITTIEQLVNMKGKDLLRIQGIGKKSFREIRTKLEKEGLKLQCNEEW